MVKINFKRITFFCRQPHFTEVTIIRTYKFHRFLFHYTVPPFLFLFSREKKSTVVKINFHGGKNQFSSLLTRANFRAGYACTGNTLIWLAGIRGWTFNTLIWLAGIRGKTCNTFIWLAGVRGKTCSLAPNKFYRDCQPIKWEYYLCTRSRHGSLRVSQGRKIDFYHRGNWFLNTLETDFYHRGNWFLLTYRWKLIFTVLEFLSLYVPGTETRVKVYSLL